MNHEKKKGGNPFFLVYDRNNYEFVKDEYVLGVVDVFKSVYD